MSDRMPEYMPDRMSEYIWDKLSEYREYMSKYTSWNVMVGITRSKVFFLSFVDTSQKTLRNPCEGMFVEPAENPMLTWKMVALLTHLGGSHWFFQTRSWKMAHVGHDFWWYIILKNMVILSVRYRYGRYRLFFQRVSHQQWLNSVVHWRCDVFCLLNINVYDILVS